MECLGQLQLRGIRNGRKISIVERLIVNFREAERQLKKTKRRVKRLEEIIVKYGEARQHLKEMKKKVQLLEARLKAKEKEERNYKLVRVYTTQGNPTNYFWAQNKVPTLFFSPPRYP